jgi:altronate dehydratase large subunit
MSDLLGYRRANGTWGVRNHVLVMPAQAAASTAAEQLAAATPGAVAVTHQWEGDRDDRDALLVQRTLAGFCANPNVASVLIVGITDDDRALAESVAAQGCETGFVALAEHGGTRRAVDAARPIVASLVADARRLRREPMPISALVLGLECGASDALSGITANPALGIASDLLVAGGGTSILAEVPELVGAETLLAARAVTPEVGRRVISVVHRFEAAVRALGVDVRGAQPAPGNIEGGLSTIEEKALGAAKKGGEAPVAGVLEYAQVPPGTGLYIMDTPGHDIEQMVGMVAGGCQLVAFTTGRHANGFTDRSLPEDRYQQHGLRTHGRRHRPGRRHHPRRPRDHAVDGTTHLRRDPHGCHRRPHELRATRPPRVRAALQLNWAWPGTVAPMMHPKHALYPCGGPMRSAVLVTLLIGSSHRRDSLRVSASPDKFTLAGYRFCGWRDLETKAWQMTWSEELAGAFLRAFARNMTCRSARRNVHRCGTRPSAVQADAARLPLLAAAERPRVRGRPLRQALQRRVAFRWQTGA